MVYGLLATNPTLNRNYQYLETSENLSLRIEYRYPLLGDEIFSSTIIITFLQCNIFMEKNPTF